MDGLVHHHHRILNLIHTWSIKALNGTIVKRKKKQWFRYEKDDEKTKIWFLKTIVF